MTRLDLGILQQPAPDLTADLGSLFLVGDSHRVRRLVVIEP
jgi:hypothetical protein